MDKHHENIIKRLEQVVEVSKNVLSLGSFFDYFSGPDISYDIKFFNSENELELYMQDLYADEREAC